MFKVTNTIYTVNCGEHETKISAMMDLACGVPFIEIVDLDSTKEKVNLRFLDKHSLEQLISSLQTIKNELDRFDMSDQPVS